MKNLKTKLLLSLSVIFALSLVACGNSQGKSTNSQSGLDKIKSTKKLHVGVKQDIPNFGYKDPATGKFSGLEIELADKIAKELGAEAVYIPVTAQTRGPLLDNNQADLIIATFTISDERKKTYNFTEPYFTDEAGFLVRKSDNFKDIQDLNGKNIGVAQSSSTKENLEILAKENGVKFTYSELADYPTLKLSLTAKRTDAFAVDKSILSGYVDDKTEILNTGFAKQEYGIASKKSNQDLNDKVESLIKEWKNNGELAKLYEKYNLTDASNK